MIDRMLMAKFHLSRFGKSADALKGIDALFEKPWAPPHISIREDGIVLTFLRHARTGVEGLSIRIEIDIKPGLPVLRFVVVDADMGDDYDSEYDPAPLPELLGMIDAAVESIVKDRHIQRCTD